MDAIARDFQQAHMQYSGPLLARTLSPNAPASDPSRLRRFYASGNNRDDLQFTLIGNHATTLRISKAQGSAWIDVYIALWKAVGEILNIEDGIQQDWTRVYETWKELTNALIKGYSSAGFESWTVPCLYVTGRFLRVFAIKADETGQTKDPVAFHADQEDIAGESARNEKLEDAARVINRIFTLCISDRAPIAESRKWGLYHTTNLLFKTYFKLNSIGLSKNILRALQAASADMPPIESFPKSHIVTFQYYVGVIAFLEENYAKAEENLTAALNQCLSSAQRNKELILTYLIPCRLLTSQRLPTARLLNPYPNLQLLFTDLSRAIKNGNLAAFDTALALNEDEFVKRRIYLTLERGRDIALRNLLRKVYLAGGYDESKDGGAPLRRTRISVAEFAAALRLGTGIVDGMVDTDEVECILANMIYKNLIKGYISRERGIVVLSKGGAFPGTAA